MTQAKVLQVPRPLTEAQIVAAKAAASALQFLFFAKAKS